MHKWIKHYNTHYKKHLRVIASGSKRGLKSDLYDRSEGFEFLFTELLNLTNSELQIIETGTVRKPNNWKDGNSGMIFAELVKMQGGFVRSVDLKKNAVNAANEFIDNNYFKAYQSDSVAWLESLDDLSNVDLFYLDRGNDSCSTGLSSIFSATGDPNPKFAMSASELNIITSKKESIIDNNESVVALLFEGI